MGKLELRLRILRVGREGHGSGEGKHPAQLLREFHGSSPIDGASTRRPPARYTGAQSDPGDSLVGLEIFVAVLPLNGESYGDVAKTAEAVNARQVADT